MVVHDCNSALGRLKIYKLGVYGQPGLYMILLQKHGNQILLKKKKDEIIFDYYFSKRIILIF